MKLNQYSYPIFQDTDLFSFLYEGNVSFENLVVNDSPEVKQLIEYAQLPVVLESSLDYTKSVKEQDEINQHNWLVPDECFYFNPKEYCLAQCKTSEEKTRVIEELDAFEQKGMIPLLKVLKYVVDTFRQNNIVWGVGRGSSVSSYVLYLLGIHRINSLQYNLDWREFLR